MLIIVVMLLFANKLYWNRNWLPCSYIQSLFIHYSAAEAFFKHAIEIKENTLGPDHPALVKVALFLA